MNEELEETLRRRRRMHYDEYSQYEPDDGGHECLADLGLSETEMYDYAFHRGMNRMAGLLLRVSDSTGTADESDAEGDE